MSIKSTPIALPESGEIAIASKKSHGFSIIFNYVEVLKPLPSVLLAYIGAGAAVIAGGGQLTARLGLVAVAALIASAGANGLTNYLDRDIDNRLRRTCWRALPSKRINPPKKVLPLIISLIMAGLALAWMLHPCVFAADAGGTLVAATWRKKVTCVFPQGVLASCAPVLMGWLAIRQSLTLELWQ